MTRWNSPEGGLRLPRRAWLGPADRMPLTLSEVDRGDLVPQDQAHVVRPLYREPDRLVRWWLCSCGQSVVRVRPRPYPPRHA